MDFQKLMDEFKAFQAIAFPEMHRLIAACDLAEKQALEVLRRCQ